MSARGAIASDNIRGHGKHSSAPKDMAPERHGSKCPDECSVHLCTVIREIGEIQPTRTRLAPPAIRMKAFPSSAIGRRCRARARLPASAKAPGLFFHNQFAGRSSYFPAQNPIFGKSTAPGERPPGVEVVDY
jgi:hypothetical protein